MGVKNSRLILNLIFILTFSGHQVFANTKVRSLCADAIALIPTEVDWDGHSNRQINREFPYLVLDSATLFSAGDIVFMVEDTPGSVPGKHSDPNKLNLIQLDRVLANDVVVTDAVEKKDLIPLTSALDIAQERGIVFGETEKDAVASLLANPRLRSKLFRLYGQSLIPEAIRTQRNIPTGAAMTEISEDGIIFDSFNDFAVAMRVFAYASELKAADGTQNNMVEEAYKLGGDAGVTFLKSHLPNSSAILERTLDRIFEDVKKSGRFKRDWGYDAIGTRFYKTGINVRTVENKLILGINASFVGSAPERELATTMKKERGLRGYKLTAPLSDPQSGYIAVDTKKIFSSILTAEQISRVNENLKEGIVDHDEDLFDVEGIPLEIEVRIVQKYETAEKKMDWMIRRGYSLDPGILISPYAPIGSQSPREGIFQAGAALQIQVRIPGREAVYDKTTKQKIAGIIERLERSIIAAELSLSPP